MIVLAELTPLDPILGTRTTLRATTANNRKITGLNDFVWHPAISAPPSIGIRLFKGDFDGAAAPNGGSLSIQIDRFIRTHPNARRLIWQGARVKLWAGEIGQAWPWPQVYEGLVDGDNFTADGNQVKLNIKSDPSPFEKDALTLKYLGTGTAEGGDSLKGQPKPFLLGRCSNVEPVLINADYNVYQFSGYGPIQAVNVLYERGSPFPASTGDYASYAALVGAGIPNGGWGTCLALGLIRLGAPQYGVITGDVDGDKFGGTWRRKTGEIVQRIASNAGVSASVDAASWNALDTALAGLANQGRIGYFLNGQKSVMDCASELAAPCNAQAGVSLLGKLFTCRIVIGAGTLTLDAQQRQLPRVVSCEESGVSPPYSYIQFGYDRAWRVHSADEIAFVAPPEPGATVGAPSGTYVAGVLAQTVISTQSSQATAISAQATDIAAINTDVDNLFATYGTTISAAAALAATEAARDTTLVYKSDAQTAAGVATSQQALATAAASAAQASVTVAASVGQGALNLNPQFAAYTNATGAPDGWVVYASPTSTTRVTGLQGRYGCEQISATDTTAGIIQENLRPYVKGWWVFDWQYKFTFGDTGANGFNGTGIFAYPQDDAGGNTQGVIVADFKALYGAPVIGKTYAGSKLVEFTGTVQTNFVLLGLSNWTGFSGSKPGKRGAWLQLAMRLATPAEIAAQTELPALQASVTTNTSAIATVDGKYGAYYGLKLDAGGTVTSIEAMATGAGVSKLKFSASNIELNGDVVVNGTLSIADKAIDLSIPTGKLADYAVNKIWVFTQSSQIPTSGFLGQGVGYSVVSGIITKSYANSALRIDASLGIWSNNDISNQHKVGYRVAGSGSGFTYLTGSGLSIPVGSTEIGTRQSDWVTLIVSDGTYDSAATASRTFFIDYNSLAAGDYEFILTTYRGSSWGGADTYVLPGATIAITDIRK
jgi:hypothetical protein